MKTIYVLFAFLSLQIWNNTATQLFAQHSEKIRIIITDNQDGVIHTIDTIVSAAVPVETIVKQLGYDPVSLEADKNSSLQRKVSIKTKSIQKLPEYAKKTREIDVHKLMDLPSNAIIEDIEGGKRILIPEVDEFGNTIMRERKVWFNKEPISNIFSSDYDSSKQVTKVFTRTYVRPISKQPITEQFPSDHLNSWPAPEVNPASKNLGYPKTLKKELKTVRKLPSKSARITPKPITAPKKKEKKLASKVSVILLDFDKFNKTTIVEKDVALKEAKTLQVGNFAVTPDYGKDYFRFTFNMPSSKEANFKIYDILGNTFYEEKFQSNKYNRLLSKLPVNQKGTYLVVITQGRKKFTKKFTIQ